MNKCRNGGVRENKCERTSGVRTKCKRMTKQEVKIDKKEKGAYEHPLRKKNLRKPADFGDTGLFTGKRVETLQNVVEKPSRWGRRVLQNSGDDGRRWSHTKEPKDIDQKNVKRYTDPEKKKSQVTDPQGGDGQQGEVFRNQRDAPAGGCGW